MMQFTIESKSLQQLFPLRQPLGRHGNSALIDASGGTVTVTVNGKTRVQSAEVTADGTMQMSTGCLTRLRAIPSLFSGLLTLRSAWENVPKILPRSGAKVGSVSKECLRVENTLSGSSALISLLGVESVSREQSQVIDMVWRDELADRIPYFVFEDGKAKVCIMRSRNKVRALEQIGLFNFSIGIPLHLKRIPQYLKKRDLALISEELSVRSGKIFVGDAELRSWG